MRPVILAIALAGSACDSQPQDNGSKSPAAAEAVLPVDKRQSSPPKVIPIPKDQAELDRMILGGYTPHADHLHPPGVKSCPLTESGDAVM